MKAYNFQLTKLALLIVILNISVTELFGMHLNLGLVALILTRCGYKIRLCMKLNDVNLY